MVIAAKLTRLTHKIAILPHLVAESCTICSSRSRRPVRKLLDTPQLVVTRRNVRICIKENLLLFIPLSLRTEHRASTVPRHPRLLFQLLGSIRHLVGLLGGGISPAQGLYLQRTTQHRKTQTNIHTPSRIRTCDPNVRAGKTRAKFDDQGNWPEFSRSGIYA
jgi:hypothetical protein